MGERKLWQIGRNKSSGKLGDEAEDRKTDVDKRLSIKPSERSDQNGVDSTTDEDTGHRRHNYNEALAMQSIHGDTVSVFTAVSQFAHKKLACKPFFQWRCRAPSPPN